MPCRDYWPTPEQEDRIAEINSLRKRNDLLAAQTCTARSVMLAVLDELRQAAGNQFPTATDPLQEWLTSKPELLVLIESETKAQTAHREEDRKDALRSARRQSRTIRESIEKIIALGGLPSNKQTKERKRLARLVSDIKASDPLHTELY